MLRRWLSFWVALLLLPVTPAFADVSLAFAVSPHEFLPGETVHLYITSSQAGPVDLVAVNAQGQVSATILDQKEIAAGANDFSWDGMVSGVALPAGAYSLQLTQEDMTVDMDITILGDGAAPAPQAQTQSSIDLVSDPQNEGEVAGADKAADADEAAGADETAASAPVESAMMTPAYMSTYTLPEKHKNCYWCTPMDIHDEEAVWGMLTAPVTILDGEQKEQVIIRKEPNNDSEGVGVVTCTSQSVHVLETRDDGWTLIECYSSSFHDSKVKAWNAFVMGYVPTKKLKTKEPRTDYGIVIDKLTQELYMFKEGHLFTTLMVSTGKYEPEAKKLQPYNETRSGEFLFVSRVGEFRSDNLFCSLAIRFNSGDLLHEVPHVKNADGSKNYKNTEPKLGTRASHGCIRVQRLKNEEGINMTWIWDNLKLNTKMVIWEDYAGRQMEYPDLNQRLYYNPNGGSNYHAADNCKGVKDEYLPLAGSFTYGELNDEKYKKLTPCPYCNPLRSISEIDEINELHKTQSPGMIPQPEK